MQIPKVQQEGKFAPRGRKVRSIGFVDGTKAMRLYDPISKKTNISNDAKIFDDELEPFSSPYEEKKEFLHLLHHAINVEDDPKSIEEAYSQPDSDKWKEAVRKELQSLEDMGTWKLVDRPPNQKVIGCKWVLRKKLKADGSLEKYKARLVAKGYTQWYGIEYEETFAPVVRFGTIRTLLSIAVQEGMKIHQMDVTTAYLNGYMEEDIFMEQPEGYATSGEESKVCHLQRSL